MTRLYLYVAIAFGVSFAGVSWAVRGFPMTWFGPGVTPLQPTVTASFGDKSAKDDEPGRREKVQDDGKAFGPTEKYLVEARELQRQTALRALDMPWGSRCAGEDRPRFLSGINEYYYHRQRQTEAYPQTYGKAGANYIAGQWSQSDDRRIDRLTQDAYAMGYLKPEDFKGPVGQMIATIVKRERVTGKGCAG